MHVTHYVISGVTPLSWIKNFLLPGTWHQLLFPYLIFPFGESSFCYDWQEPYIWTWENPYFDGLLKGEDQVLTFDIRRNIFSRNISRSTSYVGDLRHRKLIPNMSEKVMDLSLEDSVSDIILEPFDFYFQGSTGSRNISRSKSDVGDTREKIFFFKNIWKG